MSQINCGNTDKIYIHEALNELFKASAMDLILEEDILGWTDVEFIKNKYEEDPEAFIKRNNWNLVYEEEREEE